VSVASVAAVRTRSASLGDGARLAEIDRATWASAVSPAPPVAVGTDFFRPGIEPADTIVALAGADVAGYVVLSPPTPLPASAHVQMVRGLAVDPSFQRRGIGRALVEAAVGEALARRATKVRLRVLAPNVTARRLYERCGFEVEGVLRREFVLDGRDVDDLLMARMLAR
jgi:ribosomal protein S18 acetylase RimI-like enzyme